MSLRPLSFTVAALAALCALVWFLQRPAAYTQADPRVGETMLRAEFATQTAQIRLTNQGKTVLLTRQANGTWVVPSYHDLPADFTKLTQFIGSLMETRIQRLVTARADRIARLEFKDCSVTLLDPSGKELWNVTLGKNADEGGRYLRYGSEEKGYLVNSNLWVDAEPKNWANAALLELRADDLARVEIGFTDPAAPPVVATRAKQGEAWSSDQAPAGKRLNTDRVTSLLTNLTGLRFTDTAAPDAVDVTAARAHSHKFRIGTFDGRTYTVILARKPALKKPKELPASPAAADANSAPKDPEFETVPAGPVYAFITSSDTHAPINGFMQRLAFQVGEWIFAGLPETPAECWEDLPPAPPPAAQPGGKPPATPAKP